MKTLTHVVMVTMILAMSIKPVMAKKPTHKHASSHQVKSKTLEQYISKMCKRNCVNANHLNKAVYQASRRHKVPANLIKAVMKVESRFKRTASSKGNYGLMQVNYTAHRNEVSKDELLNVESNIDIGAGILSKCLVDAHNNIMKALECYKGNDSPGYKQEVKKALIVIASLN